MHKLLFILLALCLLGCKCPQYIAGDSTDSTRVEIRLDSVYIYAHDSVYVDRWREGDTTYIQVEKWCTRYKDKIVMQHDTIYKSDVQTIVQVQKQKGFVYYCGWVLIALVCGAALVGIAKVALKFV